MCPIYLQTRVDVVLLQRIQAEHPLHDPLRRCGMCSSSGETEQQSKSHTYGCEEDAFINCLFCDFSLSCAGQKVIQPTTVTPNCSSSVSWPLRQDKWPVTLWQWSGLSSKHKVNICIFPDPLFFSNLRRFMHLICLLCFPAFSSDSRPASGVLQGLVGIYERRGLRGYYNGMGASFVRAIPCALINYTLTRKFENVFSSMESWM